VIAINFAQGKWHHYELLLSVIGVTTDGKQARYNKFDIIDWNY